MSKCTAFDLSILHINVSNQQVPINLHNIDVSNDKDIQTLYIQDVQQMEYSQMAQHFTPPEMSKVFLGEMPGLPQEGQLRRIKATFQDVLKGIGKHKYRQVQLLIDDNVKPII